MKLPIARAVLGAPLLISSAFAFAQSTSCPFNVDNAASGTGVADPLRDGVVLMRYALGARDATTLVSGTTLDFNTTKAVIENNLTKLDINGNNAFDVEDAAVINRVLFGFAEKGLTRALVAPDFRSRVTDRAMKAFIDGGCVPATVASLSDPAHVEASRFLTQATFGPSHRSIVAFKNLNPSGTQTQRIETWLNAQYAMPRQLTHWGYTQQRQRDVDAINVGAVYPATLTRFFSESIRESFYTSALFAEDQLRQRVAFALSQIMVVSSSGGSNDPYELAAYLDMLADNAFGNVRTLIASVALSNAMGRYLDHAGNDGNSATPNENFARELLQLFTIGLVQLNQDGTNVSGDPPTYDEDTVKGFARVFTSFNHTDPFTAADGNDRHGLAHPRWVYTPDREADIWAPEDNSNNVIGYAPEIMKQRSRNAWLSPMSPWPGRHSTEAKQLLKYTYPAGMSPVGSVCSRATNNPVTFAAGTAILPALTRTRVNGGNNGTTPADANSSFNDAIDNVFCHPTLGPFISKSLIRFFVTSTPTPAYVARVTAKFNNNGSGVRGDMRAILTAIFTDPEAVSPSTLSTADQRKFGKLKEPMLRFTAALRAYESTSLAGRARMQDINSVEGGLNQGPLQSPSVFNFFHPEFTPPGPISAVNAYGPEFEITTTTSIAGTANFIGGALWRGDEKGNTHRQAGYFPTSGCSPFASPEPLRDECLYSDLSPLYAVADDAGAMLDQINLILMQGKLSSAARTDYIAAINSVYPTVALPASPTATQINNWQSARRSRVKMALWFATQSVEFQIQR